jgi:hypothetical protein
MLRCRPENPWVEESVVLGSLPRAVARLVGVIAGCALGVSWITGVSWAVGLPDGRAYEMVSPGVKQGNEVAVESSRSQAAAGEQPGLPAAFEFASLGAFGDVRGTAISTQYLAQRSGISGTSGWSTHAITPRQDPLSLLASSNGLEPGYYGFDDDLTRGVFRSWSALTDAPNVAHVPNLYVREDLRTPGEGFYRLVTDAPVLQPPPDLFSVSGFPRLADSTPDMRHLVFEASKRLTSDARQGVQQVYKVDDGVTRLIGPGIAGQGASAGFYTLRILSADGSRVIVATGAGLFQFDDRGTPERADDVFLPLSVSESPGSLGTLMPARYEIASIDGSRVFLRTDAALTNGSLGGGLYMWERKGTDEEQSVTVSAPGGSFILSLRSEQSAGPVDASTDPLPVSASAAQVQAALERLTDVGSGNVIVTGSPGAYVVHFTGGLSGVNIAELTGDAGPGGAVTVRTIRDVQNLTLIANFSGLSGLGALGASTDGHRLYFAGLPGLVNGQPTDGTAAIYLWQDADRRVGGSLSIVGGADIGELPPVTNQGLAGVAPKVTRVSPDGQTLVFELINGIGLAPRYAGLPCVQSVDNPNNSSGAGCSQLFLYRADKSSQMSGDVVCVSCPASGGEPNDSAYINARIAASATLKGTHLSHALTDDGRFVFFSSPEALVSDDTNGKYDVYEYDVQAERVHLLSSGKDTSDSWFLDASRDGRDVYFVTRAQLVGWDRDNANDVYDARISGGFPEPAATRPECDGDACQGQAVAPPRAPVLSSSHFRGAGNKRASVRGKRRGKRCRRGQVKRRVRGRVRCVRARHKRAHARGRGRDGKRRAK